MCFAQDGEREFFDRVQREKDFCFLIRIPKIE
jgi:hypothetical protein